MEKIRTDCSIELVVEKVNEIVDCLNATCELKVQEIKRNMNFLKYGIYASDEDVDKGMLRQLHGYEYETKIRGLNNKQNGGNEVKEGDKN